MKILFLLALSLVVSGQSGGRIVILGSSTAAGAGASSPDRSWVGRLTVALVPLGYVVMNRSIAGSSTQDSLQRFLRDVPLFRPDFVVLATAVTNEYYFQDPEGALARYLSNTRRLISMVEEIGAIPIIAGPNPNGAYTRSDRARIRSLYSELEGEGVPVWNLFDAADDGLGRWLPGLSIDGLHPTDAGHEQLSASIPLSLFRTSTDRRRIYNAPLSGSWQIRAQPDCGQPLTIRMDRPASSWTISFDSESHQTAPALVWEGAGLQVLRSGDRVALLSNWNPVAGAENLPAIVSIQIVRNALRQNTRLYVNGILQGEINSADPTDLTSFSLGSVRPGGSQDAFRQLLLYRVPLDPVSVAAAAAGHPPAASLDLWLPMNETPDRSIMNASGSADRIFICPGAWQWIGPAFAAVSQ